MRRRSFFAPRRPLARSSASRMRVRPMRRRAKACSTARSTVTQSSVAARSMMVRSTVVQGMASRVKVSARGRERVAWTTMPGRRFGVEQSTVTCTGPGSARSSRMCAATERWLRTAAVPQASTAANQRPSG